MLTDRTEDEQHHRLHTAAGERPNLPQTRDAAPQHGEAGRRHGRDVRLLAYWSNGWAVDGTRSGLGASDHGGAQSLATIRLWCVISCEHVAPT